jgi:hypothetical protein
LTNLQANDKLNFPKLGGHADEKYCLIVANVTLKLSEDL